MQSTRKSFLLASFFSLILFITPQAFSQGEIKLQGHVSLDIEQCSKGTTAPDCVLDFAIKGKAAKLIYDAMPSEGKMQECTGEVEKFNGSGMHCIKGKTTKDYYCDFSYNFTKDNFGAGPDGC